MRVGSFVVPFSRVQSIYIYIYAQSTIMRPYSEVGAGDVRLYAYKHITTYHKNPRDLVRGARVCVSVLTY